MRAGKVWMEFDDGTEGWVPTSRVAEAKKDGGKVSSFAKSTQKRLGESVRATADAVPGVALMAVGGGLARIPATVNRLARATAGVTGLGSAGGAGQAVREGAYRATGAGDAPGTVGGESLKQASLGLGGEILAGATEATAIPLMMWAQSNRGAPWSELMSRAQAAIRERVPVGANPFVPGGVKGSEQAKSLRQFRDLRADELLDDITKYGPKEGPGVFSGGLRGSTSGETRGVARTLRADDGKAPFQSEGGVKFRLDGVLPGLKALRSQAARIPGYKGSVKKIDTIISDLMEKYGGRDLSLREVRQLRQDMDAMSSVVKEASGQGKNPKALSPLKRTWDAISNDMRQVLRDPALGSDIQPAEAAVQSAMLAEKGAVAGERGLHPAMRGAITGTASGAAAMLHNPGFQAGDVLPILATNAAAHTILDPVVASRLALLNSNPWLLRTLRYGPPAIGAANPPRE